MSSVSVLLQDLQQQQHARADSIRPLDSRLVVHMLVDTLEQQLLASGRLSLELSFCISMRAEDMLMCSRAAQLDSMEILGVLQLKSACM